MKKNEGVTYNFYGDIGGRAVVAHNYQHTTISPESKTPEELISILKSRYDIQSSRPLIKEAQDYYIPLDASLIPFAEVKDKQEDQRKSLHDSFILPFLADRSQPLLLLLGDSGAGKSTYIQWLAMEMWIKLKTNPDGFIPIVIELGSVILHKDQVDLGRFIETVFESNYGLSQADIRTLKSLKILFVFDGYDEKCGGEFNLYKANNLAEWNAKVLITCRLQHVHSKRNYKQFFSLKDHFKCYELYVCPFDRSKIDRYLQNTLSSGAKNSIGSLEWYRDIFQEYPQLVELVQNPLLLKMVVVALPRMISSLKYEQLLERKHERVMHLPEFTRAQIYESFIEDWFEREAQRYAEKTGKQKMKYWDFQALYAQRAFSRFCQRLSWEMLLQNVTEITYTESNEESETEDLEDDHAAKNPWELFFTDDDPTLVDVRMGCPLRCVYGKYSFYHKSFIEYFAALRLFEELHSEQKLDEGEEDVIKILNAKRLYISRILLTQVPGVGDRFAEMLRGDHRRMERLLFLVLRSSTGVAAANAMTVLNRSRFNFSRINFKGVNISGASLKDAVCDGTDFEYANVSNVDFDNAWLSNCNFLHANMKNIKVGRYPALRFMQTNGMRLKAIYSPDGSVIAVSYDQTVHIVDAITREIIKTMQFDADIDIQNIVFFETGKLLAFSTRNEVGILDVESMREKCNRLVFEDKICSLAVSLDGSIIAAGHGHGIHLIESENLSFIETLGPITSWVTQIKFSVDGKTLFASYSDGIMIWNIVDNVLIRELKKHHNGHINSFCTNHDDKLLVSKDWHTLELWSLTDGRYLGEIQDLVNTGGSISSIAFHPSLDLLAISGQWIWLLDVKEKKIVGEISGGGRDVQFSKDGNTLIAIQSNEVCAYPLKFTLQDSLKKTKFSFKSVFSPKYKVIISAEENIFQIRSLCDYQIKREFSADKQQVIAIAVSSNGERFASLSRDSKVRIWSVGTLDLLMTFQVNQRECLDKIIISGAIALDHQANACVIVAEKRIEIWSLVEQKCQRVLTPAVETVNGVCFSADGNKILFHDEEKIHIVSMGFDQKTKSIQTNGKMGTDVSVNLSNNVIAFVLNDNSVVLQDLNSLDRYLQLDFSDEEISGVSFNSSGNFLAIVLGEKTIIFDISMMSIVAENHVVMSNVIWEGNNLIEVGYNDLKYWKRCTNTESIEWYLHWRSHSFFDATHCRIDCLTEPPSLEQRVLLQYGALRDAECASHESVCKVEVNVVDSNDSFLEYSIESLFEAVISDYVHIVAKWLNPQNVRVINEENQSLLHLSCSRTMAELLIRHGLKVDAVDHKQKTVLHIAAKYGYDFLIDLLVKHGLSLDAKDHKGRTALHTAVIYKQEQFVHELLKYNVDLEALDDESHTPLHLASIDGNPEIIHALIEKGANIEARDAGQKTPILYALSKGSNRTDVLLKYKPDVTAVDIDGNGVFHLGVAGFARLNHRYRQMGADIHLRNYDGTPPLYYAVCMGIGPTETLLNLGSDIEVSGSFGDTPLFFTLGKWGCFSAMVFEFLVERGANIHARAKNNITLAHLPIYTNNPTALEMLLEYPIDLRLMNDNGDNCLHLAAIINNVECMAVLLASDKGRKLIDLRDSKQGKTAVAKSAFLGCANTLRMLLDCTPNLEIQDNENATALHSAVRFLDNLECLKLLVEAGADVNATDGETYVIHRAIRSISDKDKSDKTNRDNKKMLINYLLEKGARIDVVDIRGFSVIECASELGSDAIEIIELLLSHGADIYSCQKNTKNTVLHTAAKEGRLHIVSFLLQNEINFTIKNDDGKQAIELARENGHEEIVLMLTNAQAKAELVQKKSPRFFRSYVTDESDHEKEEVSQGIYEDDKGKNHESSEEMDDSQESNSAGT